MPVEHLNVAVRGRGLHEITHEVAAIVEAAQIGDGLCTVFVQHTSASLVIQENADPDVLVDMESSMNLNLISKQSKGRGSRFRSEKKLADNSTHKLFI